MEYKIAWGESPIGLSTAVRLLIAEGWKPQGGMCSATARVFYQAMVREN